MTDASDLVVEEDGSLAATHAEALNRLAAHAGSYKFAVDLPGMLVLRRLGAQEEDSPRVLMAGEIVTRMTVMEVINTIAMAQWRGKLSIYGPDAIRSMAIDGGTLKYATSNSVDDRLGEVIFQAGLVGRADLEEMLQEVSADRRVGELLVERGIVDQAQLFQLLQRQAEQIFYNALLTASGYYVFVLPVDDDEPPSTTIHVPIQGLLMEGVQRIDEMALFRSKIPSGRLVPVHARPVPAGRRLEEDHLLVLDCIDGTKTIDEIARESALGTFRTNKAIYHLLQQRFIELHSGRHASREVILDLVGRFNEVMQDIFVAVATYGGVEQTRTTLDSWIIGSGYGPVFGDGIDEMGCIDAERVVAALQDVELDNPIEALLQALHELAAFTLFSATTALPREQELILARDVNARLKAIRVE